jgi:transcriptional regulator with XRE-family HTH domain
VRQPTTTTTLAEIWGSRVAERRGELGLSQTRLAELCDVTQQTISKIEAGGMIPHDNLKLTIANAMALEPAELFAWPPRAGLAAGVA